MMDYIRLFQVEGRKAPSRAQSGGLKRGQRRRAPGVEMLERRELLSTTQNFDTPGTTFALQQIGGPPPPNVVSGGPTGNFMQLATTPTSPVAGNDNSMSFVTSDPGTFNQITADWDFGVSPTAPGARGTGYSFALLNTGNFGTTGPAASPLPQQGIYNGSFAFGFDTADDTVFLSLNAAIVTATNLTGQLDLASNQFIHAHAVVNFVTATVSLVLTPSLVGSPVTVFNSTFVPGLTPYQSRVSYEAKNSDAAHAASFAFDNINVQFTGARSPGTISFGSPSYVVSENQPDALIDIVRTSGTAGSFTVNFVAADGTGRNDVNYVAVAGPVTFGEGVNIVTVAVPIINDHLFNGDKTVKLFLSNPTLQAPLGEPIVSILTITEANAPPPVVSSTVQLIRAPHSRRVTGFRLTFSQSMTMTSAENLGNYEVILPPARKHGPKRTVALSSAVLDSTGTMVTLTRLNNLQHLTKVFQILVRGMPTTGLLSTSGTFLAGRNGQSGTDALLTVSA
jgi:hypothetical protein